MKKSRFSEAQIVGVLKELARGTGHETGPKARRHPSTIRDWRDKYAGLQTSDLVRLKQLEAENAQMQRIIARQTLELDAVKELISKKAGARAAPRSGRDAATKGPVSVPRLPHRGPTAPIAVVQAQRKASR